MNDYIVIEDLFGEEQKNQLSSTRGYMGQTNTSPQLDSFEEVMYPSKKRFEKRTIGGGVKDIAKRDMLERNEQVESKGESPVSQFIPVRHPQTIQSSGQQINHIVSTPPYKKVHEHYQHTEDGYDSLKCRDVFLHVENCPVCSAYFKKDIKFYWLIILILIGIIVMLLRKDIK